jgi:phospholipid-binding lipoprotein MlaA
MGPLNVRDGVGRVLDIVTDPVGLAFGGLETDFGKARTGVTIVDLRAVYDRPGLPSAEGHHRPLRHHPLGLRAAYREAFVREATGDAEALPDFDDRPRKPPPQGTRRRPNHDPRPGKTMTQHPPPGAAPTPRFWRFGAAALAGRSGLAPNRPP